MATASPLSLLLSSALSGGVTPLILWKSGAVLAFLGIFADTFGAHGLKNRDGITADDLAAWMTASRYAVSNGLGLMLVSMRPRPSTLRFAGPAILTGGVLFSGSILVLVLRRCRQRARPKFLGLITPFGGIIMMAGYLSLAL